MIDNDHQTFIAASVFALGLFLVGVAPAAALVGHPFEPAPAVPVAILAGPSRHTIVTTVPTVGELLRTQGIRLGPGDRVEPDASTPVAAGLEVRIIRRLSWIRAIRHRIAARTIQRNDPALPTGASRIAFAGSPGTAELTYRYTKDGNARAERHLIAKRILRGPRARILVHGIGEYSAFAGLAVRGFQGTVRLAGSALRMIATAYTASCSGCSGFTASGVRAGHGIVAVDPRVIPLGSKLYIPGYGRAVAGDTGGAILGHRIDLGFNSEGDALRFGRRPITVYLVR
ncbi:MAG: 3D domain-containing protein [Candidatus Baltobacteraceae bacterium]